MLVRLVALENAYEPILVNLLGEANDTLTRLVAPVNVFALIVVTPDGIVILESLVAPSKAWSPILVKLLGEANETLSRPVVPRNAW